jgi:hypothetical protein
MQYERRVIDAKKGLVQITFPDERWYEKIVDDKIIYIPSITWVVSYWPKGIGFMKWMASHGFDEAESIKEASGEKGTHIHHAIGMLLDGKEIDFNTVIDDKEITAEEYAAVMSFVDWHNEYKPLIKKTEFTVFSDDDTFAGTLDLWCEINGEDWVIDFKSSADIWPSHELQVMAYRRALGVDARLGILQVGYKRNKRKWKFTEVTDDFTLFQAVYQIWKKETAGVQPLQREYPLSLSLNLKEEK